ncbi:hypothetical protein GOP47_0000370 [Adiantum capillus-veneris]|uniref:Transmembrane 9 superfamily member n=1 Tax=Adiantum capillus-veneris TaxID=13818 RepID=A0A9D4VEL1_ADICA|nr:hypothetical protein GOP47_0000370 [Adiantum capillus-veneris]
MLLRSPFPPALLLASLLLLSLHLTSASDYNHKYGDEEKVVLWVNKVGPYYNPQETYNYYSLPFCSPNGEIPGHKWGGLGEVLQGNELIDSQIDIKFKKDVERSPICSIKMDASKEREFKDAIENTYWFELFMDDLPLWGFVGEYNPEMKDDSKHLLYSHKNFLVKYNQDQIIQVNITQDSPQRLIPGKSLELTYSISWQETNVPFARRFDAYLDYPFFEHQIHWFSIFNSFMMVIFLTGLVSMILMRTLRHDYAKYAREEDDLETLERDVSEESGWKLVHGDVFRSPKNLVLLSALVGTGAQLSALMLLVILLAIVGMLYVGRGAIVTVFIVSYAFTSFIAGYVSGSLYGRNDGKHWIKSMLVTASLFPFTCFGIGFILNFVAISYGSLAAIPFGTMVVVFIIWAFISFPLALLGTVIGRNWSGAPNNPCRVKTIPRPIPERKWYLTPSVISIMGGLLPFGSIFIEMYFVFSSFWNYKVYYVYGFMLLVVLILIIVTVCVTIVGTYFLLNAENYHWQWTSFYSAASTAVYVYLYSIYYYHMKTKMTGFFQLSFYFGYTLMFCIGLGILCGAMGYLGSSMFVRRIYRNIKCD